MGDEVSAIWVLLAGPGAGTVSFIVVEVLKWARGAFSGATRRKSQDRVPAVRKRHIVRPFRKTESIRERPSGARTTSYIGFLPREIHAIGRVPLERAIPQSRMSKMWVWLRLIRLRPSSPKPAFAIDRLEVYEPPNDDDEQEYSPGGFWLTIFLHRTESRMHFIRTMRSGLLPWGRRTLVVCTPDELYYRDTPVRCFGIRAPMIWKRQREYFRVGVSSSDPLVSYVLHEEYLSPDDIPPDAIWLIMISELSPMVESEGTKRSKMVTLEPMSNRVRRYALHLVLLVALAVFLVVIFRPLRTSNTTDPSLNLEIALFLLLYSVEYMLAAWDLTHWMREFAERRNLRIGHRRTAWTASTTRCLADGDRIRNRAGGLVEHGP